MPTFRNLYYASSVVIPNPDLEAEHGWNYEIGYKYSENGRRLNLTAFRIDIKDQIVAVKNLVDNQSYQTNAAKYRNTGIELRYEHDVDKHFTYNVGAEIDKHQNKYNENKKKIDN